MISRDLHARLLRSTMEGPAPHPGRGPLVLLAVVLAVTAVVGLL